MPKKPPVSVVASLPLYHDPYALTPTELAHALDRVKVIRAWCDGVESAALAALIAQQKVPGYRLGFNRPQQKWLDEDKTIQLAKKKKLDEDEFMPRELVPPTKLLKLLKQNNIAEEPFIKLTTRNEPKLVVTDEDNTYYTEVNVVDLAEHLARQTQDDTGAALVKSTKRKAR